MTGDPTAAGPAGRRPSLSIVIVNTNHRELLEQCLRALEAAELPEPTEIHVVDNASTDGSVEMVAARFPAVRLIRKTSRRGPGHNYNSGFAEAQGEFVLVLNEDAEVTPDALARLFEFLRENPSVAIAAPRLIYPSGEPQQCCHRFPNFGFVVKRLVLQAFLEGPWVSHGYQEELEGIPFRPDWIMATCLMIRRSALDEVGPYDERFEVYFEETDLARRLRDRSWELAWLPDAVVRHHHGVSNFKLRGDRDILFRLLLYQSRYRYFQKHHGTLVTTGIRVLEAVFFGLYALKNVLESLLPARRAVTTMKARLYWCLFTYSLTLRGSFSVPQP
jgi:GT2 family glycosyltransferase